MTHPLIIMVSYSMQIFKVKTFANCPKTSKFAKVFTRERFPLYDTQRRLGMYNVGALVLDISALFLSILSES